mmetsp:Transcript_111793/g.280020  ORF Transcript_111793/g.280020 Transcript_111793/m.280020 type:complete len:210 (+) Transcript_111793:498-1127(+)
MRTMRKSRQQSWPPMMRRRRDPRLVRSLRRRSQHSFAACTSVVTLPSWMNWTRPSRNTGAQSWNCTSVSATSMGRRQRIWTELSDGTQVVPSMTSPRSLRCLVVAVRATRITPTTIALAHWVKSAERTRTDVEATWARAMKIGKRETVDTEVGGGMATMVLRMVVCRSQRVTFQPRLLREMLRRPFLPLPPPPPHRGELRQKLQAGDPH